MSEPTPTACPYDTNDDGDCGRPLCPYCSLVKPSPETLTAVDELVEKLFGDLHFAVPEQWRLHIKNRIEEALDADRERIGTLVREQFGIVPPFRDELIRRIENP